MLSPTFSPMIHIPMRSPVRGSPAARSAPAIMKYSSCPMLHTNIVRRYGSAAARTSGDAWTSSRSAGRQHVSDRREHAEREDDRRQEGLVDDAVDFFGIVGAGEARDEHAHAREQRGDEDDDDEKDLPADADRGVAGEPDVVTNHDVIDDALEAADHVLDHRGPRQTPHGARDGTFDDRAIEFLGGGMQDFTAIQLATKVNGWPSSNCVGDEGLARAGRCSRSHRLANASHRNG